MSKSYERLMQNFIFLLLLILKFEILAEKDENDPEFETTVPTKQDIQPGEIFSKCYEELGCIKTDDQWYSKKYRPVNLKPLDRHIIKTTFVLIRENKTSTESNEIFYQTVTPTVDSLTNAGYKKETSLFLLIHDFTSNGYTGWVKHISKVLKSRTEKCNIISVDWSDGSQPPYDQAIANARVVALELIKLLTHLKEKHSFSSQQMHIIGHGVGAHIAGYVGHIINGTRKITGLDPSGPRFEEMPAIVRLDPTDANYVEILHTDGMKDDSQGIRQITGHTDFFLNNADIQPGCPKEQPSYDLLTVTRDMLIAGEVLPGCSHKRAYKYFIESLEVENCTFLGMKCGSYQQFEQGICTKCGINCRTFGLSNYSEPNIGSYFLQTGTKKPYCLFQYKVKIQIKNGKSSYFGYFKFILIDKNHYATTSSMLESREFKPGNTNSFVFYAGNPEMSKIVSARVGWYQKASIFCLVNCKESISVEKVTIESINSSTENAQAVELCPHGSITEIQNGSFQDFVPCKK